MKFTLLALFAIYSSVSICTPTSASWGSWSGPAPSATIDSGTVVGKTVPPPGTGLPSVNQFLSIPFAKPPVGDLRFAPPQSPSAWAAPKLTTRLPPACLQDFGNATQHRQFEIDIFDTPGPVNGESEDCLYLNIYTPAGGSEGKAVFFWIYGGAFKIGSSSLPLYDGTSFAANQDVVVVTSNYRTNVFGFPRSPQLPLDEQNLAFLDQRLALDWVQRNIHAFGGDPSKVTIAGESAGGISVSNLVTTIPDNPPFRAAICQSGTAVTQITNAQPNNITTPWTALMALINCTQSSDAEVLACARAVKASEIQKVVQKSGIPFAYYVSDNITYLQDPLAAYPAGKVAKVPVLTGSNFNDGTAFAFGLNNLTEYLKSQPLLSSLPSLVSASEKLYAPGSPAVQGLTTGHQIVAKFITDSTFLCPASFLANITATYAKAPAWLYLFNATFPNTQHPQYPHLGAYHSSEIPLVFGTYPTANATASEKQLSASMQKAWGDFVKDPYAGPGWKEFPAIQVLEGTSANAAEVTESVSALEQICPVWDDVYLAGLSNTGASTTT